MIVRPRAYADVFYHPGLDRLIGGDYIQDIDGRRTSVSLTSADQAAGLYQRLTDFDDQYEVEPGQSDTRPYPLPLAVVEHETYPMWIDGVQELAPAQYLLDTADLLLAPVRYRQLAVIVTSIPSVPPAATRSADLDHRDSSFATRLGATVAFTHHRFDGVLNFGVGSCVTPETVGVDGSLLDCYFLTRCASLAPEQVPIARCRDVTDLLTLVVNVGIVDAGSARTGLLAAVAAYRGDRSDDTIEGLIIDLAETASAPRVSRWQVRKLAAAIAVELIESTADSE
jgi:hypothetical protein